MRSWSNYFLFHECMLFIGKAHGFWRSSRIGGRGEIGGGGGELFWRDKDKLFLTYYLHFAKFRTTVLKLSLQFTNKFTENVFCPCKQTGQNCQEN